MSTLTCQRRISTILESVLAPAPGRYTAGHANGYGGSSGERTPPLSSGSSSSSYWSFCLSAFRGSSNIRQTITITIGANTKVLLTNGVASIAAAQPGDRGMVKVRASRLAFKSATLTDVQNALQNQPAHQVIDWGPAS